MKQYEKYKKSGVSWLDNVPFHWGGCRFKDTFILTKGLSITKKNLEEEGVPVVNYGEVHSRCGFEVDPERHKLPCVKREFLKASPKSLLKSGDFVFADTSEDLEGSGNFTHLASKKRIFAGYHTIIAKPQNNFPRYLAYLADSHEFRAQIRSSVKGVKVFSITKRILNPLTLILPPLSEQKTISAYLDWETERIDRKVGFLEDKMRLYKELKQSLIHETVFRGLDKSPPFRDSGIDWIGEIPNHWDVKRVVDVAMQRKKKNLGLRNKNLLSLSYGRIKRRDFDTAHGLLPASFETYQIVAPGNVILRLTDLQNDRKSLRVGLVKEKGIITSAYLNLGFTKYTFPTYFYYLLHAFDIVKVFYWQGGGLRQSMKFDDIKVLPVIVPPIEEQQTIAKYLDQKTTKIDQVVEMINEQVKLLKELRKTLINDVVTGKICITDTEEPPS